MEASEDLHIVVDPHHQKMYNSRQTPQNQKLSI